MIATKQRTYRATVAEMIELTEHTLVEVHGFARMNIDGHRTLFIDDITRRQSQP